MKNNLIMLFYILSLFLFLPNQKKLHAQSYDETLPYVDPTGAYQLYTLLRREVIPTKTRTRALNILDKYLEVQYKYGGNGDSSGIDCSALTCLLYKNTLKKNIPRTAKQQYKYGIPIKKKKDLKFGDLVFFKINSKTVSHVGIFIFAGHFVHASSSLGVTINRLDENYYKKRYIGARRISKFN